MLISGKCKWILCVLGPLLAAGCAGPSAAALELIDVARKGITLASETQQNQYAALIDQYQGHIAALDAAFDSDAKLAEAGQISTAAGQAVPLTARWVIEARKGYIAARDALSRQIQAAELAHRTNQDNLQAADESLEMAAVLILQQMDIHESIKSKVLSIRENAR